MKAVHIEKAGGPEVLKPVELNDPRPDDYGLLVKLQAAGINPVDTKLRARGSYYPDRLPAILGCDGAGIVQEVGKKVTRFKKGDEVYFCYGGLGAHPGTYAQFAVVPEIAAARKPSSLSFTEAAAVPLVLLTAWEALHDRARIEKGRHVLIHAGAGGVGHVAIQLAKLAGCKVATTVSSEDKAEFVAQLGAEKAIFYKKEDFVKEAVAWSGGQGVDALFDTVGGETYKKSFPAVKFYGDIVTIVGAETDLDWKEIKRKNLRVSVEYMLTPMIEGLQNALQRQAHILEQGAELLDAGKLRIHVRTTMPLEKAGEAHRLLEEGSSKGKIVLEIH